MKKLLIVVVSILLITGCDKNLKSKNDELTNKVTTLEEKVSDLEVRNGELKTENENLKDKIPVDDGSTCTFIRTFKLVDKLNFQGQTPDIKFIILDQFQANEPFIVQVKTEIYNTLEKNKNYEFTFTGKKSNDQLLNKISGNKNLFDLFTLDKVAVTNKGGLEQTQDPCR